LAGCNPAAEPGSDAGNAELAPQSGVTGNSDESDIGTATVTLAAPTRNERRLSAGLTMKGIEKPSRT